MPSRDYQSRVIIKTHQIWEMREPLQGQDLIIKILLMDHLTGNHLMPSIKN